MADGLKNPRSRSGKTNILLIRTGEAKPYHGGGMKELSKINRLHLIVTAANKSSALSFVIDGVSNDA